MLVFKVTLMKKMKNENIVELIEYFGSSNNCYLILEYCNNGDLESKLTFLVNNVKNYYKKSII